ncbi:hypothetical protein CC1G_14488 [Coprinopsis cinerea okayama7|uniref:Uncharacterized protein n=1 Tax=Coprinopsis cinerea (strain Okayama-7 / 130 / ATCC MYA-4618 / FGSC 9003) TaxID=240176 RepID=D6RME3_COPC7|nr:hypothetical protein CC1G_14488 [Coprinopsis cinerea okayama7\|eukprot:XP_002911490.1 hypothetical protein CC1G_14488 [Coprinopsis cinerea okayama7\
MSLFLVPDNSPSHAAKAALSDVKPPVPLGWKRSSASRRAPGAPVDPGQCSRGVRFRLNPLYRNTFVQRQTFSISSTLNSKGLSRVSDSLSPSIPFSKYYYKLPTLRTGPSSFNHDQRHCKIGESIVIVR